MKEFDQIDFLPNEYIYTSEKNVRNKFRFFIAVILLQIFLIPFIILHQNSIKTYNQLQKKYEVLKTTVENRQLSLKKQKYIQDIHDSVLYLQNINQQPDYNRLLMNYLNGFHPETWIKNLSISMPISKESKNINVSGTAILSSPEALKKLNQNIQLYRGHLQSSEKITINDNSVNEIKWESRE